MQSSLLQNMTKDFLIPPSMLEYLIKSCSYRYKRYTIPKRNGGVRQIAHPAKEVKKVQRWIVKNVLSDFQVHECATAYSKGNSIAKNAEVHSLNSYLVKMDLRNFFPSIRPDDFEQFLANVAPNKYSQVDIELLTHALFWKPKRKQEFELAIGAPSSPLLSNILMYNFDACMKLWCDTFNVCYTRYADDLTFSTNRRGISSEIIEFVRRITREMRSPSLSVNEEKTVVASKACSRRVTGITITNDGEISIGRPRKRALRAKAKHYSKYGLSNEEQKRLKGLLDFANDVEPDFVRNLEEKFPSIKDLSMNIEG